MYGPKMPQERTLKAKQGVNYASNAPQPRGWRAWFHVPWHCPYCIFTGVQIGIFLIVLAIGAAHWWAR